MSGRPPRIIPSARARPDVVADAVEIVKKPFSWVPLLTAAFVIVSLGAMVKACEDESARSRQKYRLVKQTECMALLRNYSEGDMQQVCGAILQASNFWHMSDCIKANAGRPADQIGRICREVAP